MPSTQTGEPILSDADLVRMVTNQVSSALEALYDRYGKNCYALARRVVVDEHRAQDVVQEAFMALWKKPTAYDPKRSFETWILSVTHHKAVDAVRKEQRWRDWAETELPEPAVPVEEEAWASVRGSKLREALKDLPDAQREVLTLAYFGGLTQQQIADRTGVPLGTVKTRTLLGMKRLRAALQPLQTNVEIER